MGKFCWHNICIFSKKIGLIAEAELKILFWKCVNDGPVKCPDPVTPANGGGIITFCSWIPVFVGMTKTGDC